MINTYKWLRNDNIDARMVMQVHDELVFEVHETILYDFKARLNETMCTATNLDVPLLVDIGTGANWDQAH